MMSVARRIPLLVALVTLSGCSVADKLVSAVGGGSCSGPKTLATSGSVSGSTNGVNCKFPDGSTGNLYTLTASQPTNVELTVTPSGFTPYIGAWTSTGQLLGQTNATPSRLRLFLGVGSYQVGVSAINNDGNFTLASAPAEVTNCKAGPGGPLNGDDMGIATRGAVISGAATNADCGNNADRADGYLLAPATSGSTWTLSVTSDRAVGLEVWAGSQSLASKSLTTAGSTSVTFTAASATDLRVFVHGAPGTGAINYTLTIN